MASYRNPYANQSAQINSIATNLADAFLPNSAGAVNANLYNMRAQRYADLALKSQLDAEKLRMENEKTLQDQEQARIISEGLYGSGLLNSLFPNNQFAPEVGNAIINRIVGSTDLLPALSAQGLGTLQGPDDATAANNFVARTSVFGGRNPSPNSPGSMAGRQQIAQMDADIDVDKQTRINAAKPDPAQKQFELEGLENLKLDLNTDLNDKPLEFTGDAEIDQKMSDYMTGLVQDIYDAQIAAGRSHGQALTAARYGMTNRRLIQVDKFEVPGAFNDVKLPKLIVEDFRNMLKAGQTRQVSQIMRDGFEFNEKQTEFVIGEILK